jgi:hypothetical protein
MAGNCAGNSSRVRSWGLLRVPSGAPYRAIHEHRAAAILRETMPFPGGLFLCMTAVHAAGRLVLQSLREPEADSGKFGTQHWISAATLLISPAAGCLLALQVTNRGGAYRARFFPAVDTDLNPGCSCVVGIRWLR